MPQTKTLTPKIIIETLHELWSWREYPEARADFLAFLVGQQIGYGSGEIQLQWTAYVYGWITHKQFITEKQLGCMRESQNPHRETARP